MPPRALPISLPEYKAFLNSLWPDIPRRLGLAVSGGVDSMALSHLTRRLVEEQQVREVHAFIVDHGVRAESSSEASSVAEVLKSYGFKPQIIPLFWEPKDLPKSGFESRARSARYRALARACLQADIDKLLLAHHADDQAETVMMRLISGSRLDGLGAMKSLAPIPECWDIFRANRVTVGRPFLALGKERLQATCECSSVQWFDDTTNHDATYTRRNTVRQLLTSTTHHLPRALQRDSLVALASRAEERNRTIKETALHLINTHCRIVISERTGSVDIRFPEDREVLWKHISPAVLQRILVAIAEKASPARRVKTQHMITAFEKVLSAANEDTVKVFTCAGLTWSYNGRQRWTLSREPLSEQKRSSSMLVVGPEFSEWMLWDGRWWVMVETPQGYQSVIRALDSMDMKAMKLRATEISADLRHMLDTMLGEELGKGLRFTVPAIFWRRKVGGSVGEKMEDVIVALPTLKLTFRKGANYAIRYKDC